jgi:hypothetical protein
MRNVIISNVQATGVGSIGCPISGLPGHPIENLTLSNIRIRFRGGGTAEQAVRRIPEEPTKYPELDMFGVLPAYGLFCRHVENLRLERVDLGFDKQDHRPSIVCQDVTDLSIVDLRTESTPSTQALVRLEQVRGALIRGCRLPGKVATFLRVEGTESRDITVVSNDLRAAAEIVAIGEGAEEKAVHVDGTGP